MQWCTHFTGAILVNDLKCRKMTEEEAVAWIGARTNQPFHPNAMYKVHWPQDNQPHGWFEHPQMRMHVMSDYELDLLEKEVRKSGKVGHGKPWEPSMYESARESARAG